MKKIFIILFIVMFDLCCFGCSSTKGNLNVEDDTLSISAENFYDDEVQDENSLFTDYFFEDVVIIYSNRGGVVTGDQVEPVIEFLKSLSLTETDEHVSTKTEDGEQLYGTGVITFRKSNGYDITFYMDGYVFTCESTTTLADTFSYMANENIYEELEYAFEQGEAISAS